MKSNAKVESPTKEQVIPEHSGWSLRFLNRYTDPGCVKVGDRVKLIFEMVVPAKGENEVLELGERMWVKVESIQRGKASIGRNRALSRLKKLLEMGSRLPHLVRHPLKTRIEMDKTT
ncbi:MAG: hypothetical protein EP346_07885 [Bacteroidetes bacterium]|nr:MAG: hypothetical protein EP346_07885 [Bacteroidota bacterium]